MNFYYCDACHYCFEAKSLSDRCPDCGKTQWGENPAVRPATEKEIADLLRARADDDELSVTPPVFMGGVFSQKVYGILLHPLNTVQDYFYQLRCGWSL